MIIYIFCDSWNLLASIAAKRLETKQDWNQKPETDAQSVLNVNLTFVDWFSEKLLFKCFILQHYSKVFCQKQTGIALRSDLVEISRHSILHLKFLKVAV